MIFAERAKPSMTPWPISIELLACFDGSTLELSYYA